VGPRQEGVSKEKKRAVRNLALFERIIPFLTDKSIQFGAKMEAGKTKGTSILETLF
jgi:hypothetical protein